MHLCAVCLPLIQNILVGIIDGSVPNAGIFVSNTCVLCRFKLLCLSVWEAEAGRAF